MVILSINSFRSYTITSRRTQDFYICTKMNINAYFTTINFIFATTGSPCSTVRLNLSPYQNSSKTFAIIILVWM